MISFNIPLLMVVVFLVLIVYTAFRKTSIPTTFRAYAVGDKECDTTTLVITVLATAYGGAMVVGNVIGTHHFGLPYIIYTLLVAVFAFWLIGWLALYMVPFMCHLSMSESIGRVYGYYPRLITAIANVCYSIVVITMQIRMMALAISFCVDGIHPAILTFLAILTIIFYTTIGGVRIITFMDIVQFFTFFLMLPLLFFWIPKKTGIPPPDMVYALFTTQERFQFSSFFQTRDTNPMIWISDLLSMLTIYITPPVIQRIYMSFDRFQASKVFFIAGGYSLLIKLFIVLIGLMTAAAMPKLSQTEVWPYLLTDIPPVVKGFTVIGLLAISMSTADSYLNSASVMFSNDIVQAMVGKKTIPFRDQLLWAKLGTRFIGVVSLTLSWYCDDLQELNRLGFASFTPIVTAPFIFAVLGFRATSRTALIGMAIGLLTICVWNKWIFPKTGINGAFLSMVANGLAMVATHYLVPKSKKQAKEKVKQDTNG